MVPLVYALENLQMIFEDPPKNIPIIAISDGNKLNATIIGKIAMNIVKTAPMITNARIFMPRNWNNIPRNINYSHKISKIIYRAG